jgi:hypothetical protein
VRVRVRARVCGVSDWGGWWDRVAEGCGERRKGRD